MQDRVISLAFAHSPSAFNRVQSRQKIV